MKSTLANTICMKGRYYFYVYNVNNGRLLAADAKEMISFGGLRSTIETGI